MKRMLWMCMLVFVFVLSGMIVYAGDFYVISGMKKNFAPVPKTGQATSYSTGDDGDLQKGVGWPDPRFTDNGDGTVTDNLTGLIWLKQSSFAETTWLSALEDCNCLNSGESGLTDLSAEGDWRLPNIRELYSLVDISQWNPSMPAGHPFSSNLSYGYWSASTCVYDTTYVLYVDFSLGLVQHYGKTENSFYVRCVRGRK